MKQKKRRMGWIGVAVLATFSVLPGGAEEDDGRPKDIRLLEEGFEGLFSVPPDAKPYSWTADFNGDGYEDLAILGVATKTVKDAWRNLPLHNPPYEYGARWEMEHNPMFIPKYFLRKGESHVVIFHGRPPGWQSQGISETFILQDVCDETPVFAMAELPGETFEVPGFTVSFDGVPAHLRFDEGQYRLFPEE